MVAFKQRLEVVRNENGPWFALAQAMMEEAGTSPSPEKTAATIATTREVTQLSVQLLKRYLALIYRVTAIADEMGVAPGELLSPSFNAQEIAVRLYRQSRVDGADVLKRLALGETNLPRVRQLQKRLMRDSNSSSPRTVARHRRTMNAGIVEIALKKNAAAIWGSGAVVKRRPQLLYLGGWPGEEVIGADGSVVAGIDILFPDSELNRDYLEANLNKSLLLAPFFAAFYLAMPPDADDRSAARLVELLDWFGYAWVGVISVADEDSVVLTRTPTGGPDPDRTSRYEALKRKFRQTKTVG